MGKMFLDLQDCCNLRLWIEIVEGDYQHRDDSEIPLTLMYEIGYAYQELSEIELCKECTDWLGERT